MPYDYRLFFGRINIAVLIGSGCCRSHVLNLFVISDDEMKRATVKPKPSSIRSLQTVAGRGVAGAMVILGSRYQDGVGVRRDYGKAAYWYRKAAKLNETYGMFFWAQSYQFGHGVRRDWKRAATWFRKAYRGGVSAAAGHLGHMYQWGSDDFPASKRRAIYWQKKSLGRGDKPDRRAPIR